jgi:hypothetical protein
LFPEGGCSHKSFPCPVARHSRRIIGVDLPRAGRQAGSHPLVACAPWHVSSALAKPGLACRRSESHCLAVHSHIRTSTHSDRPARAKVLAATRGRTGCEFTPKIFSGRGSRDRLASALPRGRGTSLNNHPCPPGAHGPAGATLTGCHFGPGPRFPSTTVRLPRKLPRDIPTVHARQRFGDAASRIDAIPRMIIDWTHPSDFTFPGRLATRTQTCTREFTRTHTSPRRPTPRLRR